MRVNLVITHEGRSHEFNSSAILATDSQRERVNQMISILEETHAGPSRKGLASVFAGEEEIGGVTMTLLQALIIQSVKEKIDLPDSVKNFMRRAADVLKINPEQ